MHYRKALRYASHVTTTDAWFEGRRRAKRRRLEREGIGKQKQFSDRATTGGNIMSGSPAAYRMELELEHDTDQSVTLRIYRTPSGQWTGRIFAGAEEIGAVVAGCDSPEAVEQAATETGVFPDHVEVY